MVDIHSHILPNVDDGSKSWEMSVEMCRIAAQDGITHIVATPHANDEFPYDRQRLEGLLQTLRSRLNGELALSLGCDFHFSYDNLTSLEKKSERFTIGDTRYLLVEFSDYSIAPATTDKLRHLLASGLVPVITHPERNVILQHKPELVLEWAAIGCTVQVTANALTGRWGKKARDVAHWLLRHDAVHILATDCHNLESRPPVLSQGRAALETFSDKNIADALTTDNPQAVVDNRALPYFPAPKRK